MTRPQSPLADVADALDPQRGHRGAYVTNDEVSALCKALRKAVEGLAAVGHVADAVDCDPTCIDHMTDAAASALAAVRELVDLGGDDA